MASNVENEIIEKTCLWGFRQKEFQTSLLSYRDYLENRNFACSEFRYESFQKANNKGADQAARMRRLFCACVVRKPPKTGFVTSRPINDRQDVAVSCIAVIIFSKRG